MREFIIIIFFVLAMLLASLYRRSLLNGHYGDKERNETETSLSHGPNCKNDPKP